MSTSALGNEDLENVPLVRMEDVQPSRTYDVLLRTKSEEDLDLHVVKEDIEYDNECIVNNDDDSNIDNMAYQPENCVDAEGEVIVPEILDTTPKECKIPEERPTSSWPTLEILPGGLIQKPQEYDDNLCSSSLDEEANSSVMMYACAKCSQRFKYLFCLVRHVKWHEDEAKKEKRNLTKICKSTKKDTDTFVCIHNKANMTVCLKTSKKRTPKKAKS